MNHIEKQGHESPEYKTNVNHELPRPAFVTEVMKRPQKIDPTVAGMSPQRDGGGRMIPPRMVRTIVSAAASKSFAVSFFLLSASQASGSKSL